MYVSVTTAVVILAASEIGLGHAIDITWEVKVNKLENCALSRTYI